MNANSTRNVVVESGGTQVVAHVGLHALGSFADRLGVGERLSSAVGWSGPGVPVHDRGRVLCQAMLMLAGGGESCTDIESLAAQGRLFGDVCSDTTLYRTFTDSLDGDTLVRARQAIGRIRGEVWERIPAVTGGDDPVILDIDASLVEIHSENKDGTAPNFKGGFGFHPIHRSVSPTPPRRGARRPTTARQRGSQRRRRQPRSVGRRHHPASRRRGRRSLCRGGFGFHPMFCFADATGEALAARLRPGNAAANDAADNLEVLDDAITQLPADVAAGHCVDDDLGEVRRRVMVRSDSAGCTAGFVDGCRSRNIGFAVVARRKTAVSAAVAVANTDNDRWVPALNQDGTPAQPIHQDDGDDKVAMVCEVTDLVDLSSWPKGTRLIVRREPLHPGAQTSLLPDLEYRFWGHYTDQDGDPATLDRQMRAHAHVEDHIGRLKDSGLLRFPFTDFAANAAWLAVVCWGADLVRWFQLLCVTGPLARALPKRLRWQLWHTPARIVRKARGDIIRILDGWPTAPDILAAYRHVAALT